MAIDPDVTARADDFINESEKDGTPANDNGRVPKLENVDGDDARIAEAFLPAKTRFTDSIQKYLGVGGVSNTEAYNLIVTIEDPSVTAPYTDIWIESGVSLLNVFHKYWATLNVGDGSAYCENVFDYSSPDFTKDIIFELDLSFGTNGTPTTNGTEGAGFGITDDAGINGLFAVDTPASFDAVGVYVDNSDGKIYARTINGGTTTDTEITGITIANSNNYRIEFEAGVEARFYVNGILKVTTTTNLPNGSDLFFGYGCKNGSNTYFVDRSTEIMFSIQK